jgi:hypothetical protein
MFAYGIFKVFHLQMLPPHLAKLVQSYGDSSPTSLLWIFLGSSAAYSAFTGIAEMLGGLLLFNRRTTTLGALITFGALGHVLALNLSYDVSVKIWSMNLLVLTAVLIVPDLRRLINVFVLNKPIERVEFPSLFLSRKRSRIAFGIGMTCLAITLGFRLVAVANGLGRSYNRTPVPLYGIYQVDSFSLNETVLPPLLTDERRWKTLVIERSGLASIILMDNEPIDYLTSVDSETNTVTFVANPDETVTTAGATRLAYDPRIIKRRFERVIEGNSSAGRLLEYTLSNPDELTLIGQWRGDSIEVQLKRVDESEFLLLNRGFHWIQAYPFFR